MRRDIEAELEIVRKLKATKELSEEEKIRETRLLKHLEDTTNYVGTEVWKIEEAEGELA